MIDYTKLKPCGGWVLVKVDLAPEKSAGGIYLPQGNSLEQRGYRVGTVLSVGPGRFNQGKAALKAKYEPLGLEVGERVAFRGYLHDVNKYHQGIEDRMVSLIHADEIIGVVVDGTTAQ